MENKYISKTEKTFGFSKQVFENPKNLLNKFLVSSIQKMNLRKIKFYLLSIIILVLSVNFIFAAVLSGGVQTTLQGGSYQVVGSSVNPQFNSPSYYSGTGVNPSLYWNEFNTQNCQNRQDFILMIPPGGCSPAVVRSDLLEDQNFPVFCKVSSIKLNPLIDVSKLRSISFRGQYPDAVASVSYYPAREAIRSGTQQIGSPVIDNVGYLVIVLKRQYNESSMPNWVKGNLTAVIDYDAEGVYGVGKQDFFLSEMTDSDWERNYRENSFWKGKGYIRAGDIQENSASVSIYQDANKKVSTVTLKQGETSQDIFLSGYYCAAGMNIRLDQVSYPSNKALLRVDDQDMWVSKGSNIIDGKCTIGTVEPSSIGGGKISLSCPGTGNFQLVLNTAKVKLNIGGGYYSSSSANTNKNSQSSSSNQGTSSLVEGVFNLGNWLTNQDNNKQIAYIFNRIQDTGYYIENEGDNKYYIYNPNKQTAKETNVPVGEITNGKITINSVFQDEFNQNYYIKDLTSYQFDGTKFLTTSENIKNIANQETTPAGNVIFTINDWVKDDGLLYIQKAEIKKNGIGTGFWIRSHKTKGYLIELAGGDIGGTFLEAGYVDSNNNIKFYSSTSKIFELTNYKFENNKFVPVATTTVSSLFNIKLENSVTKIYRNGEYTKFYIVPSTITDDYNIKDENAGPDNFFLNKYQIAATIDNGKIEPATWYGFDYLSEERKKIINELSYYYTFDEIKTNFVKINPSGTTGSVIADNKIIGDAVVEYGNKITGYGASDSTNNQDNSNSKKSSVIDNGVCYENEYNGESYCEEGNTKKTCYCEPLTNGGYKWGCDYVKDSCGYTESGIISIGTEKIFETGDYVVSGRGKDVYVAYIGRYPNSASNYIVLVAVNNGANLPNGLSSYINSYQKYYKSAGYVLDIKKTASKVMGTDIEEKSFYDSLGKKLFEEQKLNKSDFFILRTSPISFSFWNSYNITLRDLVSEDSVLNENPNLKDYYQKSTQSYSDVFDLYPAEKMGDNEWRTESKNEFYSVMALYNSAKLSETLGLKQKQIEMLKKLIEKYPDSTLAKDAQAELDKAYRYTSNKESQALVYINNEAHFISLIDVRTPTADEAGAKLFFNTPEGSQEVDWEINSEKLIPGTKLPFKITSIKDDYITFQYTTTDTNWFVGAINTASGTTSSQTKTLKINEDAILNKDPSVYVRLSKINLKKEARVNIIPKVYGTRSQANLSFSVGIEKRAIQLSPGQTRKLIEKINNQIDTWNNINEKLEKIITGLKGACFATSAALTVKNFLGGLSGESKARQEIMSASGGWNEKCAKEKNNGNYASVMACLMKNEGQINSDIKIYSAQIEKRNSELKTIQESSEVKKTEFWFFTESYNTKDVTDKYKDNQFSGFLDNNKDVSVRLKGETADKNIGDIICGSDAECKRKSELSVEEMRDISTWASIEKDSGSSEVLKDIAKNKLSGTLTDVNTRFSFQRDEDKLIKDFEGSGVSATANLDEKSIRIQKMNPVTKSSEYYKQLNNPDQAFLLNVPSNYGDGRIAGKKIMVGLVLVGSNYDIKSAVLKDGTFTTSTLADGTLVADAVRSFYKNQKISSFSKADSQAYHNPISNQNRELKVKYYERAPYKGLPALVPFDEKGGWYAATDYILSGFGKPFEESGRAVNFWICNVGENKLIEYKKGGDDICRYYNIASPASNLFPGLSASDSNKLVSSAQSALMQAAQQYPRKKVTINKADYDAEIAENGDAAKCSDFMSPTECTLMFNVCDPVMCPSSRCDFGGQYRVDNVAQSGIIGSIVLCLPNFGSPSEGGVVIPICLTGVYDGIDNYLSILKSTKNCLNESLATGRTIGICEEIQSIYLCEFFWKQAVPLLDVAIPRIFETAAGQNARGGGEYTTVNYAWNNMQESLNFFKNQYAVNAFNAFNARSTEEAGTGICKSFISARYPTSAKFLDNLLKPESPVQFMAYFSSDVLTTATVHPVSHYKVYYHIYAGKDQGAYYKVYLKKSTQTPGLAYSSPTYFITQGYAEKGNEVDDTPDFTAQSGYDQVCVSVGEQESCDFKQVSTSFALNYLADKATASQASETQITSSKNCVSGTASLWSLAQPNLQSGAEEIINPELYNQGIVRICSSGRPDAQTELTSGQLDATKSIYDRWKQVGYCDDPSIGCWIDTQTVKDALSQNKLLQNQTLDSINTDYIGQVNYLTAETSESIKTNAITILKKIDKQDPNKFTVTSDITNVLSQLKDLSMKGIDNSYRAAGLFYIGQIYDEITKKIYKQNWQLKNAQAQSEALKAIEQQSKLGTTEAQTTSATEDALRIKILNTANSNLGVNLGIHCSAAVEKVYSLAGAEPYKTCIYSEQNKIYPYLDYNTYQTNPSAYKGYVTNLHPTKCNNVWNKDLLQQGDHVIMFNGNKYSGEHALIFDKWEDKANSIALFYDQPCSDCNKCKNCGLQHTKRDLKKTPITVIYSPVSQKTGAAKVIEKVTDIFQPSQKVEFPEDAYETADSGETLTANYDVDYINKIMNEGAALPLYPNLESQSCYKSGCCALYAKWAAKQLFNLDYNSGDAWCREYNDGIVKKFPTKDSSNNNELINLDNQGILKPGMIIAVYNPRSSFNDKIYDCTGKKGIKVEYTHNLLYLGKNNNGKLVFAELWYDKPTIRTLEGFQDNNLITMVVVTAKGTGTTTTTEKNTETTTAVSTTKYTLSSSMRQVNYLIGKYTGSAKYSDNDEIKIFADSLLSSKIITQDEYNSIAAIGITNWGEKNLNDIKNLISKYQTYSETTNPPKCTDDFCVEYTTTNDKGWILDKNRKSFEYYIKKEIEGVYSINNKNDKRAGNIQNGIIKFSESVPSELKVLETNYRFENERFTRIK